MPWSESDAESLYEFAKDLRVGPIAGWPVHTSVENSRQIIKDVLSADEIYAIVQKGEGKAIGSIGLMIGDKSNLDIGHVSLGSNPIYFILLMAPIEFASAALGIFFCCIFKCEETTSMLLSNVISILCFLGGTFFSLDGMGSAIAFASRLSPVKWLNDAFFALACDNSLIYFWPVIIGGIIISALLVLGCRLFFRTEDYL